MPRAGFVSIVGRPSSGKSTLLNALCRYKVSIVSPTPQTTRNKIRGIVTERRGQIVFLDTPGFHTSRRILNLHMRELVTESLEEADAVLYVLDATRRPGEEEGELAAALGDVTVPIVCAINKTDDRRADPARTRQFASEQLANAQILEVSAVTGTGRSELLDTLFSHLEEGPFYYPEEFYTDQDPALRIAEIVREKATAELKQEIPHALFVDIADMEMRGGHGKHGGADQSGGELLWVRAFVTVERDSQKGIVIGRGGERIRAVRTQAEAELAGLFPYPVKLDLRVKVQPKWRTNETLLNKLVR